MTQFLMSHLVFMCAVVHTRDVEDLCITRGERVVNAVHTSSDGTCGVEAVHQVLENTPPELAADVMDHGIMMTGGGALLTNLDKLLSKETGMPVLVSEDALSCVGEGTGKSLENIELLKRVVMTTKKLR